ncbi:hypothetical protein ACOME3_005685 [Neoechinorhynchus agilis]
MNIKLFIVRLITLSYDHLSDFKNQLSAVLLEGVSSGQYGILDFDWLLTDVVAIMVSWYHDKNEIAVDPSLVKQFIEFLIPLLFNSNKTILKSNLSAFREFITVFCSLLNECSLSIECIINLQKPSEEYESSKWDRYKLELIVELISKGAWKSNMNVVDKLLKIACHSEWVFVLRAVEGAAMCMMGNSLSIGEEIYDRCQSIIGSTTLDRRLQILKRVSKYCPQMVKPFLNEILVQKQTGILFGSLAELADDCLACSGVVENSDEATNVAQSLLLTFGRSNKQLSLPEIRLIGAILNLLKDDDIKSRLIGKLVNNPCDQSRVCAFFVSFLHKSIIHYKDKFYEESSTKILKFLTKQWNIVKMLECLFPSEIHDQSQYIRLCCKAILHECSKTAQYRKVVFDDPLVSVASTFLKWNPNSRRPLQVDSIVVGTTTTTYETIASFIEFSSTLNEQTSKGDHANNKREESETNENVRCGDELFERLTKRRRFNEDITDCQQANRIFGSRVIMERTHTEHQLKHHSTNMLRKFRLTRQYERLGQFPDIQIACSDLIEPLLNICIMDDECASRFMGLFVIGVLDDAQLLMSESEHKVLLRQLWEVLNSIALKSVDRTLTKTVLWLMMLMVTIYKHKDSLSNVSDLTENIITSDNILSGIHLFEEFLVHCNGRNEELRECLARLYQITGDHSLVGCILEDQSLMPAVDYEAICDYASALSLYTSKIHEGKILYLDACVTCCELMGKWERIPQLCLETLNLNVWVDLFSSFNTSNKLCSMLLKAQIRQDPRTVAEFLLNFEDEKMGSVRSRNPIEAAICCLGMQNTDLALVYVNIAKDQFFEDWTKAQSQRAFSCRNHTTFCNTLIMHQISAVSNAIAKKEKIGLLFNLDFTDHSTYTWDTYLAYRKLLDGILSNLSLLHESQVSYEQFYFEHAKCALLQNNFALALTKLRQSRQVQSDFTKDGFNVEAALCYVKAHLKRIILSDRPDNLISRLESSSCFDFLRTISRLVDQGNLDEQRVVIDYVNILEILFTHLMRFSVWTQKGVIDTLSSFCNIHCC